MVEAVDLAVCAILTKRRENFGLRVSNFPARPLGIKISRTFLADIFRATHYLPAGLFTFWKT